MHTLALPLPHRLAFITVAFEGSSTIQAFLRIMYRPRLAIAVAFALLCATCQAVVVPVENIIAVRWSTITVAQTTPFTPPAACTSSTLWVSTEAAVTPQPVDNSLYADVLLYKAHCFADLKCCPERYYYASSDRPAPEPVYAPGVCPAGYMGRMLDAPFAGANEDRIQYCCPSSLTSSYYRSASRIICVSTSTEYNNAAQRPKNTQTWHVVVATPIYIIATSDMRLRVQPRATDSLVAPHPTSSTGATAKKDRSPQGLISGLVVVVSVLTFAGSVYFVITWQSRRAERDRQRASAFNQQLAAANANTQPPGYALNDIPLQEFNVQRATDYDAASVASEPLPVYTRNRADDASSGACTPDVPLPGYAARVRANGGRPPSSGSRPRSRE